MDVEDIYISHLGEWIDQGALLRDVVYKYLVLEDGRYSVEELTLPFAIVMTQACDLEQDYKMRNSIGCDKSTAEDKNDKFLEDILMCPAFIAELLKNGDHLVDGVNRKIRRWTSEQWKVIKKNNNDRFHFLVQSEPLAIPDLAIDFKKFYTISRDELYSSYKTKYIASLKELFREDLSRRFANYISRIGLPKVVRVGEQPD